MTKLIYHKVENRYDTSPFDIAITELVSGKSIKIACPYISIYYLEKLIRLSNDWKLITDINEWINSISTESQIQNVIKFISLHKLKIRHFPTLHAKTIITDDKIFLGSSNFTDNGIFRKNELSVVISDQKNVNEINNWFESWWLVSDSVQSEMLISTFEKIQKPLKPTKQTKLPSKSPRIITKTASLNTKFYTTENLPITETEISNYLNKWGNLNWEFDFFKLLKVVIEMIPLKKESERLVVSLTKDKQITLQINNRIILKSHTEREQYSIGFILPLEFEKRLKAYDNIHKVEYFTDRKVNKSMLVRFIYQDLSKIDREIILMWKSAINEELNRSYTSPYKKYHQDIIYDIAIDENRLKEIFQSCKE